MSSDQVKPRTGEKDCILRVGLDVVVAILEWLEGPELGRLHLSGNKIMMYWMGERGAVQRIHLDYDFDTPKLRWPSIVNQWHGLTHFGYMRGRVQNEVQFDLKYEHLLMLPKSIKSISLGGDYVEHAWLCGPPSSKPKLLPDEVTPEFIDTVKRAYFDVENRLPNLEKLYLRETNSSSSSFSDCTVLWLPKSLTWFSSYWNNTLTSKSFRYLPSNLTTLRLGSNFNIAAEDCQYLPKSITKLILPRLEINDELAWSFIPRTLDSFVAKISFLPEEGSAFPPHLRKLGSIKIDAYAIPRIPRTVECLKMLDINIRDPEAFSGLPTGLKHLHLSATTSNELFKHLPPNLERLRLQPTKPLFDKNAARWAPPSLKCIVLAHQTLLDIERDPKFRNFPIKIISAKLLEH